MEFCGAQYNCVEGPIDTLCWPIATLHGYYYDARSRQGMALVCEAVGLNAALNQLCMKA